MTTDRRVFLKQLGLGALGTGFMMHVPRSLMANPEKPYTLPRGKPSAEGINPAGILSFLDAVENNPRIEPHSLMIVRHGKVVAEGWWSPYAAPLKHTLYSLSKSFTSTAIGIAVAGLKLSHIDPVIQYFSDKLPARVSNNLSDMRIEHLLMMGTGHEADTLEELRAPQNPDWEAKFLSLPVMYEPGTHFVYNTGATYMLSSIIQKVTGKTLLDYLKPRLFEPLGIEGMDWESNKQGVNLGGYGLRVKTEDIAKLGMLYLRNGRCPAGELLTPGWVDLATRAQIDNTPARAKIPKEKNDWAQGYGYQFWRCTHNAYRGDGAFGQFCIVLPEKDTVIVMTSESFDLQASMNLVWDHLYPAIQDDSLPTNSGDESKLHQRLGDLSLNPPAGKNSSPIADKISGKEITLEKNNWACQSMKLDLSAKNCTFTLRDSQGDHVVECGMGRWNLTKDFVTQKIFPIQGRPEVSTLLAASATWTDDQTLMMTWRFAETAHSDHFIFKFDDKHVTMKFLNSVAKGNPDATEKRENLLGTIS